MGQNQTLRADNPLDIRRELAKRHLIDFYKWVWWKPGETLHIGRHTKIIGDRLTKAVDDYLEGISTFVVIQVPFRHGKSDLVSRVMPPYFLGRASHREPDVIMTGYGASLVRRFSRKAKAIIKSPAYCELFPDVRISTANDSNESWNIADSSGEVNVAGLGGAIGGTGGDLIDVDDYCKNRAEAESQTYRDSTWDAFTDDVLTRRAPVSITCICATPWNVDDVAGRIRKSMDDDPSFPRFEFLTFPAQSKSYITAENTEGYLFLERFSEEWYRSQRATLGAYAAAGLLDCNPVQRGGNMFAMTWPDGRSRIQVHDRLDEFPEMRYVRFWDLASTQKERDKDDPDYTSGAKVGTTYGDSGNGSGPMVHLWIPDIVACQEEAPARDKIILQTSDRDGPTVRIAVESVAGYKDTFTTLRNILQGKRIVAKVPVSGDKVVRAAPMEPVFDAGNVHILRAPWNDLFFRHFTPFPSSGEHDDDVDSVSGGFAYCEKHFRPVRGMDRSRLGI